jgi:hypothetical protein
MNLLEKPGSKRTHANPEKGKTQSVKFSNLVLSRKISTPSKQAGKQADGHYELHQR